MNMTTQIEIYTGVIIEEEQSLSLAELCRFCALPAEQLLNMIEHGVLEPLNPKEPLPHWRFAAHYVVRVQKALRLQRDLGVNLAGAALAMELLDEITQLRKQVEFLQR